MKTVASRSLLSILALSLLFSPIWTASQNGVTLNSEGSPIWSTDTSTAGLSLQAQKKKPGCEDVHLLPKSEQCAFTRQNCEYVDTAVLPYLELYFCDLQDARTFYWVVSVVWLLVLFASIGVSASEFLTLNLGTICTMMGMSHSLAGVTFLALGNGSPDLFTTFTAMSSHSASLAIGELIGAAGFITTVVAAATGVVRPFKVKRYGLMRDVGFFAVAVAFTLIFLADGKLSLWNCLVMVVFYILYVIVVLLWHYILARLKRRKAKNAQARGHFTASPIHGRSRQASFALGSIEAEIVADNDASESQTFVDHEEMVSDDEAEEDEEEDEASNSALRDLDTTMGWTHRHRRNISRMSTTDWRRVRPSLLGALEFGSVLSKLERSRSQMGHQMSSEPMIRRHTEDPAQGSVYQERTSSHVGQISPVNGLLQPSGTGAASASTTPAGRGPEPNDLSRQRSASLNASYFMNQHTTPIQPHLPSPRNARGNWSEEPWDEYAQSQGGTASRPTTRASSIPQITVSDESTLLLQQEEGIEGASFPRYTDDPDTSLSGASVVATPAEVTPAWQSEQRKPGRLAALLIFLRCVLFPQLEGWKGKGVSDKVLSLLSTPAIFGLTLTVPVGEVLADRQPELVLPKDSSSAVLKVNDGGATTPHDTALAPPGLAATVINESEADDHDVTTWNPYLMAVQILAAPQFVLFVIWRIWLGIENYGRIWLICTGSVLGASCLALALFLLSYKSSKIPAWQRHLAFPGFCVAIAWISLIAGEVVGVLKAFQLITGFSEAILGLTVFAAGNSVSDMFANFNTARAGRPVMAFHACFGGPMLNILLGIGLGGAYHTILKSHKHAHDGSSALRTEFKIEIGRTLIVSGAGLFVTLLGLMLALWWNRWMMDRKIGIGLVAAWAIITTGNVVLELLQIKHVIKPW